MQSSVTCDLHTTCEGCGQRGSAEKWECGPQARTHTHLPERELKFLVAHEVLEPGCCQRYEPHPHLPKRELKVLVAHEVLQPDLLQVPRAARPAHASRRRRRNVSLVLRLRRSRRLRETPGKALHTRAGAGRAGAVWHPAHACLVCLHRNIMRSREAPRKALHARGGGGCVWGEREQFAASGQLEGSSWRIYRSKGAVSQPGAGLRGMEGARWFEKPGDACAYSKPLEYSWVAVRTQTP